MYAVEVRDHVMIAHSIKGEVFGPAQKLHGATYVIDVRFLRRELDENDIVVDIGLATDTVARWVFDKMKAAIAAGKLGPGARGLAGMKITLHESHNALASYEADVGA